MSEVTQTLSPPQAAKRLGVAVEKVHFWIHDGQLPSANLARDRNGKPRFKIKINDLEDFVRSRMVCQPSPKTKRRRRQPALKQYV